MSEPRIPEPRIPLPPRADRPDVSFAVASYNCVGFLEEAVNSALAQRDIGVEVLIVDDGSSDGSVDLAERLALADDRVRVFRTPANGGPGAARNVALAQMRGTWFAVLDSDDLVTPDRSAALIAAADAADADMIADDLVVFGEGMAEHRFLERFYTRPYDVTLDRYFADSAMYGARPDPGFLKPMVRRDLLVRTGISYDERLRIGEDDDLVVRLLMAGARYHVVPRPGYRYRKHAGSISHRLSVDHVDRMAATGARLRSAVRDAGLETPAFRRRDRALGNAVAFTHAIALLKQRRFLAAAGRVVGRPGSIRLFAMPLRAMIDRLRGGRPSAR